MDIYRYQWNPWISRESIDIHGIHGYPLNRWIPYIESMYMFGIHDIHGFFGHPWILWISMVLDMRAVTVPKLPQACVFYADVHKCVSRGRLRHWHAETASKARRRSAEGAVKASRSYHCRPFSLQMVTNACRGGAAGAPAPKARRRRAFGAPKARRRRAEGGPPGAWEHLRTVRRAVWDLYDGPCGTLHLQNKASGLQSSACGLQNTACAPPKKRFWIPKQRL